MASGFNDPLNLGTSEIVTIDNLVDMTAEVAHKKIIKHHDTSRPQGVRGRNSDNSLLKTVLGWEPATGLADGLEKTYSWIWEQLLQQGLARPPRPGVHRVQ
jgi:nucleoside-diphosphate-sugar epimerase